MPFVVEERNRKLNLYAWRAKIIGLKHCYCSPGFFWWLFSTEACDTLIMLAKVINFRTVFEESKLVYTNKLYA